MNESDVKESPCERLDDFLGGELTGETRRQFEDHLPECPSCRGAIADWQTLRGTLQSATRHLETPPTALVERIERESAVPAEPAATGSRTGRVAALVAAALLAAILFHDGPRSSRPPMASTSAEPAENRTTTLVPPATIQFSGNVIGVPIDIGDPKVTVVWLYPESRATDRTN
jgi:anti-sigma factor RsiW